MIPGSSGIQSVLERLPAVVGDDLRGRCLDFGFETISVPQFRVLLNLLNPSLVLIDPSLVRLDGRRLECLSVYSEKVIDRLSRKSVLGCQRRQRLNVSVAKLYALGNDKGLGVEWRSRGLFALCLGEESAIGRRLIRRPERPKPLDQEVLPMELAFPAYS
jgi:hypothetical protein